MSLRGKREELELKIQFRVDGANTALKKKRNKIVSLKINFTVVVQFSFKNKLELK